MAEKRNFFELLILNNENEIKDFLMMNGKAPKAVCPVRFINEGDQ